MINTMYGLEESPPPPPRKNAVQHCTFCKISLIITEKVEHVEKNMVCFCCVGRACGRTCGRFARCTAGCRREAFWCSSPESARFCTCATSFGESFRRPRGPRRKARAAEAPTIAPKAVSSLAATLFFCSFVHFIYFFSFSFCPVFTFFFFFSHPLFCQAPPQKKFGNLDDCGTKN